MSRSLLNLVLDVSLLIAFLALVWTATIVQFVFPPGTDAGGWLLWGVSYDRWANLQFALIALLTVGILFHIMLHWSWVCGIIASKIFCKKAKLDDGVQTLYGVGMMIVLLNVMGIAVAAAALSIRGPS